MEGISDTPGEGYLEREVKKEIEKNEARFGKSCQEIRSHIEDIGFYHDENKKLEKVLFDTVTKIKEELEFTRHCTQTYSLQSKIAPRKRLVASIVHDMTINSGHSQFELAGIHKYGSRLDTFCKQTDECLSIDTLSVSYSRPDTTPLLLCLDDSKSQPESNSTEAEEVQARKEYLEKKGFKPNSGFKWNTGESTFDLQISDSLLNEKFGFKNLCKIPVIEAFQQRKKLAEFFTKHTMSDEYRKQFWKARIGNRLRISKALFDSLVDRLNTEGIPKKAEKTIIDDLDRTFPICNDLNEGKEMYQNMKLVLCLFELYRPDIGYVQGMSYLLLMLYYYFDTFESFLYLSNLVVGNRMMRDLYTFDMRKVTAYCKIFDKFLVQESPELLEYFKKNCINTMTFSVDWFYTLFSRAFEVNIVRVMWDMFFLFGSQFVVRAGVALIAILEDEIFNEYMNEGFNFVRVRTGKLKVSRILEYALSKGMDPNNFADEIEKEYEEYIPPGKRNSSK